MLDIYLNLFCLFIVQLYRLERYDECKSVYTDLIRNSQDEYEEERKTNLAAVVASISQWEDTPLVSTLFIIVLKICWFSNIVLGLNMQQGNYHTLILFGFLKYLFLLFCRKI